MLRTGPRVVAVLNSAVAGAGIGLALSCDVRISAPSVRFFGGYGSLGLSPDTGTSYFLPCTGSRSRALQLLLDPAGIDADQALAWALVDEIAAEGTLLDAARTVAAWIGRTSREAVFATRALSDSTDPPAGAPPGGDPVADFAGRNPCRRPAVRAFLTGARR